MDVQANHRAMIPAAPPQAPVSTIEAKARLMQWAEESDVRTRAAVSGPMPLIAGLIAGMVVGSVAARALPARSSRKSPGGESPPPRAGGSSFLWPLVSRAAIWAGPHLLRHAMDPRSARKAHTTDRPPQAPGGAD